MPVEFTKSAWIKFGFKPFDLIFLVLEIKLPSVRPDMIGMMTKLKINAASATRAKMVVNASRIATENKKPIIGPTLMTKLTKEVIMVIANL